MRNKAKSKKFNYSYSVEEMIECFAKHTILAEKNRLNLINEYKENNPECSLPECLRDEFSITKALHAICKEILELKNAK